MVDPHVGEATFLEEFAPRLDEGGASAPPPVGDRGLLLLSAWHRTPPHPWGPGMLPHRMPCPTVVDEIVSCPRDSVTRATSRHGEQRQEAAMDKGIGSWPTRRAFLSGDRTALIAGERRITYTELDRRTDQLARALSAEGVRQGDRVAGLLLNSPAFVEMMLATAKLGAVFVPMNLRLSPAEVAYLLADSGADLFVYSAPLAPVARAAVTGEGVRVRTRVVVGGEPADGESQFEQLLASGEPRALGTDVDGSDLSCLMYTSGTTGRPKGAMLTHDNHLWNVVNTLSFGRGLRESDVTVTVAPMFHIGGLGVHAPAAVRRRYQPAAPVVRPGADAGGDGPGTGHGAVHGAGDVGGPDGGALLSPPRPLRPGAARLGGSAVPAAGARVLPGQGAAVPGGLRNARARPRRLHPRRRPREGEGRIDRAGRVPRRRPDRRRARRRRAHRPGRRAGRPWPQRVHRLLGPARGDRRSLPRRVVPHR